MATDPKTLTVNECVALISACDAMERDTTYWEAGFIDSMLGSTFFTEKRKEAVARMIDKYEGKGIPLDWRIKYAPPKPQPKPVEDDETIKQALGEP